MTFDEALSALLGWLGEDVEVTLQGADGQGPVLAAELHGHLQSGDELGTGPDPADSLMFILADEDGVELSTFILSKDAFRGAAWLTDAREVLEVESGAVKLLIGLRVT